MSGGGRVRFERGDCLDVFGREAPESVDAIVQDWPAGVSFMGRGWDHDKGGRAAWVAYWAERAAAGLRIAKPGAHSLTWALPRTAHWTACALEDAGWEIRDSIHHLFGTGWPKSDDQLKPAHEVWILARKPLGKGLTVAANVEQWGVGRLFTGACRVPRGLAPEERRTSATGTSRMFPGLGETTGERHNPDGGHPANQILSHCEECEATGTRVVRGPGWSEKDRGVPVSQFFQSSSRAKASPMTYATDGTETIPAFDCLAACPFCSARTLAPAGGAAPRCGACGEAMGWCCAVADLDFQGGASSVTGIRKRELSDGSGGMWGITRGHEFANDAGGSSRYFNTFTYQAKASTRERDLGLDAFLWRRAPRHPFGFERITREQWDALPPTQRAEGNVHPTVKSLALARHLCRLVTPPGGRLADGVCGSGSIPIAAWQEGFDVLACDISEEAVEIARARLAFWQTQAPSATIKTLRSAPRPRPAQPSLFDALPPREREEAQAAE